MSRSEDAGVTIRLMDVAEVQEAFAALGADRDEWRALARELGAIAEKMRCDAGLSAPHEGTMRRMPAGDLVPCYGLRCKIIAKLREKEERDA